MQPKKTRELLAITLGVIIFISGCSTFAILPDHGDDDVYAQNKKYLESPRKKVFIEITAKELLETNHQQIYLFSTWCSYCFLHLKELTPETKGTTKYVCANYDILFMEKKFKALDTLYILSNAAYGTIESQKMMSFATELTKEESRETGVPQIFEWDAERGGYKRVNVR